MKKKDYYAILGVDKTADDAAIKKAFRQLAKKYHPDTNSGNKTAEERFKEINEAYQVLSNKEKRAEYDAPEPTYSNFSYGNSYTDPFVRQTYSYTSDDFDDIFRSFFNGASENAGTRYTYTSSRGDHRRADPIPRRGDDVEKELKITLEEAEFGCEKICKVTRETACTHCQGLGMTSQGVCPTCHGKGKIRTQAERTLKVPAGINDGQVLKIRGQGKPGTNGGENGDLKVTVHLKPHKQFTRKGDDLYTRVTLSVPEAVLGCDRSVQTLSGSIEHSFPAGTQPEQMFCVRGQGAKNLSGKRGDLYITAAIEIPRKLTVKQRKLYEQLNETTRKKRT